MGRRAGFRANAYFETQLIFSKTAAGFIVSISEKFHCIVLCCSAINTVYLYEELVEVPPCNNVKKNKSTKNTKQLNACRFRVRFRFARSDSE